MVRKILVGILALVLVGGGIFAVIKLGGAQNGTKVVTSGFVEYDFARAVLGSGVEVTMLMKPGSDMHNFEPTPSDVLALAQADLFIYNGGESEEWVEKMIGGSEIPRARVLRLMDTVELKEEGEALDGEPHGSVEYDEHIWTSLANAMKMIQAVRDKLIEVYPERRAELDRNTEAYLERVVGLDAEVRRVIAGSARRELIFVDRFPFKYFVDEYGLSYTAAFPGCSEQTEASSATVAELIRKVRETEARYVLKIELTSDALARTVAEETGVEVLTLNAVHNVSAEDFRSGKTYADFWEENVEVLRRVLE